jgi:uncharacterized membrane protein
MTKYILPAIVGMLVGHTAAAALTSGLVRESYAIARTLRPRHFLANLPVMGGVLTVAAILLQIPAMAWGWSKLLGGTGGNVLLGAGDRSLAVVAIIVLVPVMPVLVRMEEEAFRDGTEGRTPLQRVTWAAVFGLVHMVVGVPLAGAVALTIAGLWFTNRYMAGYNQAATESPYPTWSFRKAEAGLASAVRTHLAWNYTAVGLLALILVYTS